MEDKTYTPPLIVMGAKPREKITIENLFNEANNPIYDLLKDPPFLRHAGWNLRTLDYPKIRKGKCWEVKNGDRKTIRFYRDGSMIAIGYADDSFLGWGQDHREFIKFPLLNSLAIVEYSYEFAELYGKMSKYFPKFRSIEFNVGIKNLQLFESGKLYFNPREVSDHLDLYDKERLKPVTQDFYEIVNIDIGTEYDSRYISYKLLSAFLLNFNIPTDKIPYIARDDSGEIYVDIEKIKSIR